MPENSRRTEGGFTPRDFSPCGICLDRGEPILLSNPGRLFTYFDQALPAIIEGLVLPLYGVGRRPIGTIWIVSHDAQHQFDQEHCRLMSRLADFSALAIERVAARKTLERNRAELTRIAQDNSHLAAIVASSGDAIIGEALSGKITSWNPGATWMFGYTAEEMIGKPLALMQVPGHDDDSLAILERIRGGERVHNYETIRRRKDGTILHVSLILSPIYDAEGRLIGASKIARDITAAHLAADALRQSEARLQDLQTDLLHVSRLSAMGQIAAMMAHELNQPLSAIANYVNAGRRLLTGGGPEKLKKLSDALERAAEQAMWAGQIIGALRSFVTRAETKKQPEPVAEIVEEASRLALISARRHGVRIQLHLASNSDLVLVDRIQIQQVLLNLMLNAVEAMVECDRREITISTRSKGQTIEVSVTDTGPGLAPEISAQLFQPFVSTKRNGMGMGLSICRSIIDAHNGDLWSEPNPGEGTIFRFTLRAA